MLGLLVPGVGMGGGGESATGFGRIEYTIPLLQLGYTLERELLEFTQADERLEFTGLEQ